MKLVIVAKTNPNVNPLVKATVFRLPLLIGIQISAMLLAVGLGCDIFGFQSYSKNGWHKHL